MGIEDLYIYYIKGGRHYIYIIKGDRRPLYMYIIIRWNEGTYIYIYIVN